MRDWSEPKDVAVPRALRTAVGGHPLVAKTLARRGIAQPGQARAFLDPAYYTPAPANELPGISKAAERLEHAVSQGERICVWGDFDVDGQTATTILVSTLRELGASVRFHIPNREREGHGINLPVLKDVVGEGVDLLVTCDTGITAHSAVEYAQGQDVDVIITDHHDLPRSGGTTVLPEAYAVVDPKMLPQTHALRELPGVGVAYKVAELLYHRAGIAGGADHYLDLLALGIVADVAVQTGDVRYLLQRGLNALRHTERLGLQVLMEIAELNPQWLTEEHIGFELAPRLNAMGRMADATPAVEFLTTEDVERARVLAHELDGLNARRKMVCDEVTQAAEAQIARDPSLLEGGALVLDHPSWPGGVIGIVAGRLAEKYHRPTILITAPPGELARGSARSIVGCDINAAIAAQAEMLEGSGGHPMAAGLSIDSARIPEFRAAVSRTVRESCGDTLASPPPTQIDGYVPLDDLSLQFVEEIERLAPFGPGNPPLTLATQGLSLKGHAAVGRTGEHLRVIVEDREGTSQEVLRWRADASTLPQGPFDLAYTVRASDFRGQRDVQVEWVDARPIKASKTSSGTERPSIDVVDHRGVSNRRDRLQNLQTEADVVVWSEGNDVVRGRDRYALVRAGSLAIWTTPPGGSELRAVLAQVLPTVVHLFAVNPGLDKPETFLASLARLAQRGIAEEGGGVDLSDLAAATAQREETVQAGLAWLEARGDVTVVEEGGGTARLAPGNGTTTDGLSEAAGRLRALLEETMAYRAYVARADAFELVNNAAPE